MRANETWTPKTGRQNPYHHNEDHVAGENKCENHVQVLMIQVLLVHLGCRFTGNNIN